MKGGGDQALIGKGGRVPGGRGLTKFLSTGDGGGGQGKNYLQIFLKNDLMALLDLSKERVYFMKCKLT